MSRVNPLRALALSALAALACAGGRSPSAPPAGRGAPGDFFPLAVGNSWTFADSSPTHPEKHQRTVRVVQRDPEGYFVDDQRGALRADADCVHDRTRRLLCAPIQVGTRWSSVVGPSATERYEIVATGETVTVPAGTFKDCVRVRSVLRSGPVENVAELTYAPGVGPVRLETFAVVKGTAQPQIQGVLESYRLADGR